MVVTTQPRSLLSNIRSALSGNSIYALCQFGMLSVLALLTNPIEVGRYALALAITAPVFLLASLKLRQVQVTDAQNEFTFGEYLGQRILSSVVATALVVLAVIALGMEPRTAATVVAVTIFKALESIVDIVYGAMQRREQMQLVAQSQAYRGIIGFAVFGGAVWLTSRVELASAALAVLTVGPIAANMWRLRKMGLLIRPTVSWHSFRRLTWLALPLGIALGVSSLSINIPRYFIEASHGTGQLGIFAALAYFMTVTSMVINSLGEAASPRLANLYFSREFKQFRTTLKKLVAMGAGIGLAGVIGVLMLGKPVLGLVFGAEYAARNDVLAVMMAGSAILYTTTFLGTALNAMRRFTVQLPINMAILGTSAAVAWMSVPAWGLMGAAIAMLAGEVVALAFYCGLLIQIILPATSKSGRRAARAVKELGYAPRHMATTRRGARNPRPFS